MGDEKTTGKAAPDKGAAARSETTGEAKTVKFRELTLELPAELPPTLLFDVTEMEAAGQNPMPVFRLLRSIVGQEQFAEIRNALAANDDVVTTIDALINDIFEQYAISLGE